MSESESDLERALALLTSARGFLCRNDAPYTREEILAWLDGAVCKANVGNVAVIEPTSGGSIWMSQNNVNAFLAEGLLTEVTADGVTRLVRP